MSPPCFTMISLVLLCRDAFAGSMTSAVGHDNGRNLLRAAARATFRSGRVSSKVVDEGRPEPRRLALGRSIDECHRAISPAAASAASVGTSASNGRIPEYFVSSWRRMPPWSERSRR